jgi:diacylglycerol kinase family enzyme
LDEGIERLEYFKNLKDVMVVVGGGDGTMGGLVDPIHKILGKDTNLIPFALGTGNDLSRAMGWGEGIKSIYDIKYFLKGLENKPMKTLLDRWRIKITSKSNPAKVLLDEKMLLYFGIGLDAKFSYRFNMIRKKYPVFFKSTVPISSLALQQVFLQPTRDFQPIHREEVGDEQGFENKGTGQLWEDSGREG